MDWFVLLVGMIVGVLIFEFSKHFFVKRAGRFIIFLIIILVLFIIASAFLVKNESFKDNVAIQTGAAIANIFTKGAEEAGDGDIIKEGYSKGSTIFNSTFKKE
ncbi:MAG: hypothetical protein QXR60_03590 [Candidatus Nanoarchaeia archaeon]